MSATKTLHRIDREVGQDDVLHVGAPNVGDRAYFNQLVDQIFQRRWFTNDGDVVKELESQLCSYLGVKHCVAVCNATLGLQLAYRALGLTGEVIVPSFTFVATAHAAQWNGLTPVFADIKRDDHTICLQSIESLINENTSAIVGVHLWGTPCQTSAIETLARKHDLAVIYDAAHAFGCADQGRMIGNFGDCEVFSFHATKFFNTFEGGAIATNNDELAERLTRMKSFGFAGMDKVVGLGTNAKMPEVCAAMGLSLMPCLEQLIDRNRHNHQLYRAHLEGLDGLRLLTHDHLQQTNWQYVVIEIDEQRFGVGRDALVDRLHARKVRARRYFYPGCHRMEPYRSMTRNQGLALPNTETIGDRVICLPTGSAVDEADIERVCRVIRGD
ncbi:dTDP-4-amino-4,6-dideoxy-D-glucose transaminase [Stieleria maiorica]|uniref:dTDP-4-amino-4,6-dideoxy-D-glucose transaminase n=1 Tax=Stieleria maiorica TaxID=2795974 RepID=A0A5B9MCD0_9BACT|nr:DegT/DnrJ/EryC1/StrS family aminotransferase [Stieleria maiorica]QEF98678.1 dTDP-4-amino-4,6-dideoxy-D-glucose transaminase [Stieleria maiorica]